MNPYLMPLICLWLAWPGDWQERYTVTGQQNHRGLFVKATGSVVIRLPAVVIHIDQERYFFMAYQSTLHTAQRAPDSRMLTCEGHLYGPQNSVDARLSIVFTPRCIQMRLGFDHQPARILWLREEKP